MGVGGVFECARAHRHQNDFIGAVGNVLVCQRGYIVT
jgi:hypothetical protein